MNKKGTLQQSEELAVVEQDEVEIDLLELLYRLIDNWKLFVVGALIGAIVMAGYSFIFATPVYEATSKLYVLSSSDSALNLSDLQIGSYLTSDYQNVFSTWEVNEMVRQNLGLDYTYKQLSEMISVENPSDTRILHITAKSADPKEAASLANEFANVARKYISSVMRTDEPSLLSEALVPEAPVSPHKLRNVALGFMIGIVLVGGVLVVQFIMDDKIKTEDDIRKYVGVPTLAVIPDEAKAEKSGPRKPMTSQMSNESRRR